MADKKLSDDLITTAELCEKLSISRQTVFNFRKQGMPVALRSGKIIRYNYVDVLNWMDNRNSGE